MITKQKKEIMFDFIYEVLKNSEKYTKVDKSEDGFFMKDKTFGNPHYLFLHTDKKNKDKINEKITKIVRNDGSYGHIFYNDGKEFMRKLNFEVQFGFLSHQVDKVIELSSYEETFVRGYMSSFNPDKEIIQTNYLNKTNKVNKLKNLFVIENPIIITKEKGLLVDKMGFVMPDYNK
jgi:uncharacterized protein YcgL (UPF0745 family)